MATLAPTLEQVTPEQPNIVEAQKIVMNPPRSIGDLIEQVNQSDTPQDIPESAVPEIGKTVTPDTNEQPLVSSVADTTLPPEAVSLLNYLAGPESRGDYTLIVGEGKEIPGTPANFQDFADHPRIVGMRTIDGPSTAAGRYMITATTWDEIRKKVPGLGDFSPANQDKAAWFLAQQDYRKRTNRNLLDDLRSGEYRFIKTGLQKTWTGLKRVKDYAPDSPTVIPKNSQEGLYPTIKYDLAGKKRQLPLSPTLEAKLDRAVADLFGGGYTFLVYSGGQKSNKEGEGTGTVRHTDGKAGDVYLVGPDNRVITDRDVLNRVKKYWLDNRLGSVGTFMPGGGMHLDEWTEETLLPGMALTWDYGT